MIGKELDKIFELWKRPFIELADDNTFIDKQWSKDLLRLFMNYGMKWFTETDVSLADDAELLELLAESGCAQVLIGFETPLKESLRNIDKTNWKYRQADNYLKAIDKIQSYGISVNGCFILGLDNDTKETFRETEVFIRESGLSEVQLTILTPFPGTGLYHKLRAEGRLLSDHFWEKCTLFDVNFIPKNFTVEELEVHFQDLMSKVYSPQAVTGRRKKYRDILKNR